jgi:hypothetical protein
MNTERLQKLAEHLLHGTLGHERFDFGIYNDAKAPICGTAGCAIGECPIIFPQYWEFDWWGDPVITGNATPWDSGEFFFDITEAEFTHLFIADGQDTAKYGGNVLSDTATRYEVANNILEFIKIKEQNETSN